VKIAQLGKGEVPIFEPGRSCRRASRVLPPTLVALASGGGFAVRQLYTDQDEVLFDAARPVILNGIEDVVTRPDLADRSIFLTLPVVADRRRQSERELWRQFELARPRILGALFDLVAHGLRTLPHVGLDRLPRMADFALWAAACETVLQPPGTFGRAYEAPTGALTMLTVLTVLTQTPFHSDEEPGEWRWPPLLAPVSIYAGRLWIMSCCRRAWRAGSMVRHAPIHRRSGHSDIAIRCGRSIRGSSPSTSVVPPSNQVTILNHNDSKDSKCFRTDT
jgi:hypothetical protein